MKVGARRNALIHQLSIRMQDGLAVCVRDGRVIDVGPERGVRLDVVEQIRIHRQIFCEGVPNRYGIIGVDAGAAEVGQIVFCKVTQLLGEPVGVVVGVGNAQAKHLRNV